MDNVTPNGWLPNTRDTRNDPTDNWFGDRGVFCILQNNCETDKLVSHCSVTPATAFEADESFSFSSSSSSSSSSVSCLLCLCLLWLWWQFFQKCSLFNGCSASKKDRGSLEGDTWLRYFAFWMFWFVVVMPSLCHVLFLYKIGTYLRRNFTFFCDTLFYIHTYFYRRFLLKSKYGGCFVFAFVFAVK